MSVLEFIAAWKWPVVVLVLAGIATWHKPVHTAVANLLSRLTKVEAPGIRATFAAGEPATLPEATIINRGVARDAHEVQQLRREAVEEIIRQAAAWGWDAARMGTFQREPVPMVRWDGDRPAIQHGVAGATEQHTRMLQEWYRTVGGS